METRENNFHPDDSHCEKFFDSLGFISAEIKEIRGQWRSTWSVACNYKDSRRNKTYYPFQDLANRPGMKGSWERHYDGDRMKTWYSCNRSYNTCQFFAGHSISDETRDIKTEDITSDLQNNLNIK